MNKKCEETKKLAHEIANEVMVKAHAGYSDLNSRFLKERQIQDDKFKEEIKEIISKVQYDLEKHKEDTKELRSLDIKTLKSIVSSWKGVISIQNITKGFGAFILALGAIGAGLTWLISHLTIK